MRSQPCQSESETDISGSEELLLLLLDLLLCHLLVYVIENLISLRLIAYYIHIHIHNLKSRSTSITSHQSETDTSGSEERLLLLLDLLLDLLLVLIENCGLLKKVQSHCALLLVYIFLNFVTICHRETHLLGLFYRKLETNRK